MWSLATSTPGTESYCLGFLATVRTNAQKLFSLTANVAPLKCGRWDRFLCRHDSGQDDEDEESLARLMSDGDQTEAGTLPVEIIEIVLRRLDVKHLKACRLVCKTWNEEACRLLKGRMFVRLKARDISTFCFHQAKASFYSSSLNVTRTRTASLLEPGITIELNVLERDARKAKEAILQHRSSLAPVRRLGVCNSIFERSSNRQEDSEACAWIINHFAPNLTHFTLSCAAASEFVVCCFTLTTHFPQLEELEVDTRFYSPLGALDSLEYHDQYVALDVLHKVINNCPKLRSFITWDGGSEFIMPEIMSRSFNFHQLQHLDIVPHSVLFQKILDQRPVLPLKSLVLRDNEYKDTDYCSILQQFAPTLERLKIKYCRFFPKDSPYENIPHFPVLKDLSLSCDFTLGSEMWLKKMPELRLLRVKRLDVSTQALRYHPSGLVILSPSVFFSCPKLRVLRAQTVKLPWHHYQRVQVMHSVVKNVFPGLRCWRTEGHCRPLGEFLATPEGRQLGYYVEELERSSWACILSDLLNVFPH